MDKHSGDSLPVHGAAGLSGISSLNIPNKVGSSAWRIPHTTDVFHDSNDVSLFSTSLPVLPHEKLNLTDSEQDSEQPVDDNLLTLGKVHKEDEGHDPFDDDFETSAIGNLLPDDEDELLAGIMDDFDLSGLPNQLEDLDENDLFVNGGGFEMDFEPQESLSFGISKMSISDGIASNGIGPYAIPNGVATVAGEHPYGEHPSRTLFVRNINSNVEDSELRTLFEQYGDIRTLYTACKHRGFVMISYYDIRAARTAMRALQNKPLRRRKLDIHFSIPKDNPSEKDINQGTLVVFNLDPSVSNDDLRQIFGAYGEVKEIRETPHKRHHKFIEFYDVRAADAALKALNRSDIAGKRIKLEPSRPGGARRNLMQQLTQELEQDEARTFRSQVGSPIAHSPPAGRNLVVLLNLIH
jgi:RNA recognition motif-containing protein